MRIKLQDSYEMARKHGLSRGHYRQCARAYKRMHAHMNIVAMARGVQEGQQIAIYLWFFYANFNRIMCVRAERWLFRINSSKGIDIGIKTHSHTHTHTHTHWSMYVHIDQIDRTSALRAKQ